MEMKSRFVAAVLLILVSFPTMADDSVTSQAHEIDVSRSKITLLINEPKMMGLTCFSGPIGELNGLSRIKIGDTIKYGKYKFSVGIIQATKFYSEFAFGGEVFARKGETVCVVAANNAALPSEDDCDALWLRIRDCRQLR